LVAAVTELFDGSRRNNVLNCYGIPINLDEPLLFRHKNSASTNPLVEKVLDGSVTNETLDIKCINDLNVRCSNSWSGSARDYLISFAGQGDDGGDGSTTTELRKFVLNRPALETNGENVVALHVSGYYHLSILHPRIRRLTDSAVGIYSSRYEMETGIQSFSTEPTQTLNQNNGLYIYEPDIAGNGGGITVNTVGMIIEDGDSVINGGWTTAVGIGLFSSRGGFNIRNHHFSLGADNTLQRGIYVTSPRTCMIDDCEMDGCGIYFGNPANNSYDPGSSAQAWFNLKIRGNIKSTGNAAGNSIMRGLVTFNSIITGTTIKDLTVDWGWADTSASTNTPMVAFCSNGTISNTNWDGENFHKVRYTPSNKNGNEGLAGVFPPGVVINLTRTDDYELDWDPEFGALYLRDISAGAGNPYIRSPTSNYLAFGRQESGVETDYWWVTNSGHLVPVLNDTRNIGSASRGIKNLYTAQTMSGIYETTPLTTLAGSDTSITVPKTGVTADSIVLCTVKVGTMSTGRTIVVGNVTPATNQFVVKLSNQGGSAFNGTAKISYVVFQPSYTPS